MNKYQEELDTLTKSAVFTSEILQELVDRATPKKAIKDEIQDIRYITKYICPKCGGKITGRVSDYCYHCGQALDWSDEE